MNILPTGTDSDISIKDAFEYAAHPASGADAGMSLMTAAAPPRARVSTIALVIAEHRVILSLIVGYIAVGGAALTITHRAWPLAFFDKWFALFWAALSSGWLGWQFVRHPRKLRRALVPARLLAAILVAGIVLPTQITFQSLKQSIGPVVGFHADPYLHALDVRLHGGMAWEWLRPLLAHPHLVDAVDNLYFAWFSALLAFVMWASWTRHRVLRQRAVTSFLLMWILAGTVIAALASSGGPCYFGSLVNGVNPYQPLLARLDAINSPETPLRARTAQMALWAFRQEDKWGFFGGISAMPSLHVGIAVLYFIIGSRRSRIAGVVLGLYAVVIAIGSVLLGWHYAVDGYAGALLAFLCWKLAGWMLSGRDADAARRVEALIAARR